MPFQRIPRVSDLLPGAIKGLWTIGDTSSWHVEIGTNAANESGIRLYGADGVSKLIDLDVTSGIASITGAIIRTAATGARVELNQNGNRAPYVDLFSGSASEIAAGYLTAIATVAGASGQLQTILTSGDVGGFVAELVLLSESPDGSKPARISTNCTLTDAIGHPFPRWADAAERTMHAATITPTLDANGEVVIPHGLANAPVFANASVGIAGTSYSCEVGSVNATDFTVRVFITNTGARAAGASPTMRWFAIG